MCNTQRKLGTSCTSKPYQEHLCHILGSSATHLPSLRELLEDFSVHAITSTPGQQGAIQSASTRRVLRMHGEVSPLAEVASKQTVFICSYLTCVFFNLWSTITTGDSSQSFAAAVSRSSLLQESIKEHEQISVLCYRHAKYTVHAYSTHRVFFVCLF